MAKGSEILYDKTYKELGKSSKEAKIPVSEIKKMTPEEYENYCKNKGW